jgi:hypothetical protein
MSQIARLHSTDIANGNLIDATHLNNEYNQLVAESNSQDTRLTATESNATLLGNSLESVICGLVVEYNAANKINIKPGTCRDSSNTELMKLPTPIIVDLAVSGMFGLDSGSEAANTWYYVWLIKNPSTGLVAGLFSTSTTTPTLPSGFTKKRLLPIAVRNDGSNNIVPFIVGSGWPGRPKVIYNSLEFVAGFRLVSAGNATSFTAIANMTNWVPPIAKLVDFRLGMTSNATAGKTTLRPTGSGLTTGVSVANQNGNDTFWQVVDFPTDANQSVDYKVSAASQSLDVYCWGYTVTEVSP